MKIAKAALRLAARRALEEPPRSYKTTVVIRPGIVVGSRLLATKKNETSREIAIRTSLDREVGLLRHEDGHWRTIPNVKEVVVAVPSIDDANSIEVFGFDPTAMLEVFDAAVEKAQKNRKLAFKAPVFIALDEIKKEKSSGPIASGLKYRAKWQTVISLYSLVPSSVEPNIGFINRVKREFAELTGVDVGKVVVEFRIIA